MVKKTADKLGQEGIHELANTLNKPVASGGLLSGEDLVMVPMSRDLFVCLRNSINLIHNGLGAEEALGVALPQGKQRHSHLEVVRKRALGIMFAKMVSDRPEYVRAAIADEIGQSTLATIGRNGKRMSARTIQRYYAKAQVPWDEIDEDMRQVLSQFIEGAEEMLRIFHDK